MHHLTTFQLLLVAMAWAFGLHFVRVGRVALKNAWRLEHAGAASAGSSWSPRVAPSGVQPARKLSKPGDAPKRLAPRASKP